MKREIIIAAAILAAGVAHGQAIIANRTAAGGIDVDTANVITVMPESLFTNCVFWLPSSRDGAGTYYDHSAARLDGVQAVATNRPAWTNAGLGSYTFDGSSDFIDISSVTGVMAALTAGTISGWAQVLTSADTFHPLLSFTRSSGTRFEVWFYADMRAANNKRWDAICLYNGSVTWRYVGTNNSALAAVNTWVHWAIAHNGTAPVVYLNGAPMPGTWLTETDKTRWLDDVLAGTAVAAIGRANIAGTLYWGNVREDDVRIFSRALTPLEIGTMTTNTGRGKL